MVKRNPSTQGNNSGKLPLARNPRQEGDDTSLREPPNDNTLFGDLGRFDFLCDKLVERIDGFHETGFVVHPAGFGGEVGKRGNVEPSIEDTNMRIMWSVSLGRVGRIRAWLTQAFGSPSSW